MFNNVLNLARLTGIPLRPPTMHVDIAEYIATYTCTIGVRQNTKKENLVQFFAWCRMAESKQLWGCHT